MYATDLQVGLLLLSYSVHRILNYKNCCIEVLVAKNKIHLKINSEQLVYIII